MAKADLKRERTAISDDFLEVAVAVVQGGGQDRGVVAALSGFHYLPAASSGLASTDRRRQGQGRQQPRKQVSPFSLRTNSGLV